MRVIVIDEIGTRWRRPPPTIAERGVTLIGTARGQTPRSLMNPTLSDLVGGIGSHPLRREARRRAPNGPGAQAPPTFDVVSDRRSRTPGHPQERRRVVDALLAAINRSPGAPTHRQRRRRDRQEADPESMPPLVGDYATTRATEKRPIIALDLPVRRFAQQIERAMQPASQRRHLADLGRRRWSSRSRRSSASNSPSSNRSPPTTSIYSIKTNTTTQIQLALRDVFNLGSIDGEEVALREAEGRSVR